jgi:hypothetical protein
MTKLIAANGTVLRNLVKVVLMCQAPGGAPATVSAVVSPDLPGGALLGRHDLVALGILPADFPAVHQCLLKPKRNCIPAILAAIDRIEAKYRREKTNDDVLEEGQAELAPPTREEELDPAEMVNKTVKRIASTNPRLEELIRKEAGRGVLGSSLGNAAGKMKGDPMHIEMNKDFIKPCRVSTARVVPHHYRDAADSSSPNLSRQSLWLGSQVQHLGVRQLISSPSRMEKYALSLITEL